jgi:hypothetical protein
MRKEQLARSIIFCFSFNAMPLAARQLHRSMVVHAHGESAGRRNLTIGWCAVACNYSDDMMHGFTVVRQPALRLM